ncbi:hypothetical protein V8D89_007378, partial [Ganoderma adspersum]
HQTPYAAQALASGVLQCFTCEQPGHISRNCPQQQKARAPNVPIGAGAICFEHLEELADRARKVKTDIHLSTVAIPSDMEDVGREAAGTPKSTLMDGSLPTEAGEFVRAQFLAHFDSQEALEAGIAPVERFSIWCTETTVEVTDHLLGVAHTRTFLDTYEIMLEQLEDPNWSVSEAIQAEWNKWVRDTPPPDWAVGFPDCRTEHNTHPALHWLRANTLTFMQDKYPNCAANTEILQIDPCRVGYM